MDKRLEEISLRLSEYSIGDFNNTIHISYRLDEIDAISNVINMLREELKARTVSRDYFTNVFNSVSGRPQRLTSTFARPDIHLKKTQTRDMR